MDLYEEEAFRRIIKLKQKKLPPAAIRDYYTKYSESLNKEYGLDPSHDIKEMMRAILA